MSSALSEASLFVAVEASPFPLKAQMQFDLVQPAIGRCLLPISS